jgi:cobalt-zinc-cadmium resistance protein CzcA
VRGTTPVLIGDVAEVREAPATRRGMAHRLKGEVVSARIIKQFGSDTVKVADGIRQAVVEIQRGLPKGVVLRIVYDQSALVQSALGGVGRAVLLGAAFVVLVLFALLGDVRAAVIVTLTIPMSIALAGMLLDRLNVGLNTMTLGGLAIAVGLLVDAAIIVTENIVHRLTGTPRDAHQDIAVRAATEVGRPIAFATIIVIAVFLPLFGMSGIEGRMYQPLAAAVMAAVAASLLLALTVVPVVGALVLRPRKSGAPEDVWLIRTIKRLYAPVLDSCLTHRLVVLVIAVVVTVPALFVATRIGSDFMPRLDEGALLLQTVLPPEASLEEVDRLNHRVEDLLREIPEVDDVVRRTGRAEATEDPMPHTTSDVLVVLKDERHRDMDGIEDAMRDRLKDVPGVTVLFTTPLGMRIDEGLGGTPADISVRLFGPDLSELTRLAERTRQLMSGVRGVSDLRAEQVSGLPQLRITVDRSATARVGLSPGDVIRAVRIALVGEKESEIWIGQRRFDLVVRLPDEKRNDIHAIRSLFVDSHEGTRIPLAQLATIEQAFGPGAIRREAGSRRVAVEASATGRDLGGVAADIQQTLRRDLQLPQGYFFNVGGRVESQARASQS